ncbi:MAG: hypothetical protein RJQ10_13095 [Haliea sp.]|uniref:hypothetical protein n=1 Tax=Haliea sp. TaxID=1932666 RepID=UPI0032EF5181
MDSFTRRYLYLLGVVLLVVLVMWLTGRDGRVAELNAQLAQDPLLADYPYEFRVLEIENRVAIINSPRSARMSVMHFLYAAFPELQGKDVQHPDMVAAQERLARVQARAASVVEGHPEVDRVRWELDERWLAERGVTLQP